MLQKFQNQFATLSSAQATRVAIALDLAEGDENLTGEELFARCVDADFDQATIVVSLLKGADAGMKEIIGLISNKPIQHIEKGVSGLTPEKTEVKRPAAAGKERKPSSPGRRVDPRVVLEVAPNPKKPGSATHLRYAFWVVGETVSQAAERGLTSADIAYDIAKGFVKVG